MKKFSKLNKVTLAVALLLSGSIAMAQSPMLKVGDNPSTIIGKAALEVESTTKGFLPPHMTVAQRNAIASPVDGLLVYCTDGAANDAGTGLYQYNAGTTRWEYLGGSTTRFKTVSASTTMDATYMGCTVSCNATSGNQANVLPTAVGKIGQFIELYRADNTNNALSFTGTSSQTISGNTTLYLYSKNDVVVVRSDGTNWFITGDNRTAQNGSSKGYYSGSLGSSSGQVINATTIDVNINANQSYGSSITVAGNTITLKAGKTYRLSADLLADSETNPTDNAAIAFGTWSTPANVINTVDYISSNTVSNGSGFGLNSDLVFNSVSSGNMGLNTSTGAFSLIAGKTYRLKWTGRFATWTDATNGWVNLQWVDAVSNVPISSLMTSVQPATYAGNTTGGSALEVVYTPTTNQTVKVRATASATGITSSSAEQEVIIQQIGSTAVTQIPASLIQGYSQSIAVAANNTSTAYTIAGFNTPPDGYYTYAVSRGDGNLAWNLSGFVIIKYGAFLQQSNITNGAGMSASSCS